MLADDEPHVRLYIRNALRPIGWSVQEEFPESLVVMLTSVASARDVVACLCAGASNFIRKDAPMAQLLGELKGGG